MALLSNVQWAGLPASYTADQTYSVQLIGLGRPSLDEIKIGCSVHESCEFYFDPTKDSVLNPNSESEQDLSKIPSIKEQGFACSAKNQKFQTQKSQFVSITIQFFFSLSLSLRELSKVQIFARTVQPGSKGQSFSKATQML